MSPVRAGAAAALALVALDVGAVAAALPSARVELGSSTSGLVWVQAAYLLALAVGFLVLGPVDPGVRRRALGAAGLVLFAGGAVLASTADTTATLVAGRGLQGAGSAGLLAPALDAPGQAARVRSLPAVAVGGATLLGLALAPLVGGAVAEGAGWRWLFRLELVAAAAAALLLLGRHGPRSRPRAAPGRAPALAAGLALAVTGLVQSGPWGWASAGTLLLLAAGAALLAFAWRAGLSGRDAAALATAGSLAVALLLAPQYLELVRGLSPLRSGVLTLALTLPAAALAPLARLLPERRRGRLLRAGGLACAALGAAGMTRIDPASGYALIVVSLALLGAGIGVAARTLTSTAAAAPGAALVVAAAGALVHRAQLEEREGGGSFEDALAAGVAASGWLLATLLALAALVALRR